MCNAMKGCKFCVNESADRNLENLDYKTRKRRDRREISKARD